MWHAIKRFLSLTGLLCGFVWSGAAFGDESPDLQVGDAAPEFQCVDDRRRLWSSRDFLGKKTIVVFFYPSDFSFCCTRQAVRYRDRVRDFRNLGVEVVGISGDAVEAHRLFQSIHKLSFPLLSDSDGEVARKFGVPLRAGGKAMIADEEGQTIVDDDGRAVKVSRTVTTARWTFVINQEGRVIYRDTEVSPVKDSQEVLEFVRKLRAR